MSGLTGHISVLVADDHSLVRAGFRSILGDEEDIDVVGDAKDGAEAVEAAVSQRPDVVLMDIRMPGMDGLEATRRIAADDNLAGVKVIRHLRGLHTLDTRCVQIAPCSLERTVEIDGARRVFDQRNFKSCCPCIEPGEERRGYGHDLLVASRRFRHGAEQRRELGGALARGDRVVEPRDVRAEGEDDRAGPRQTAERLALDAEE